MLFDDSEVLKDRFEHGTICAALDRQEDIDPIQQFIHDNEPASYLESEKFLLDLDKVIEHAIKIK